MQKTEPSPVWNEYEQRWQIRTKHNGKVYKFTSSKPGKSGRMICRNKYNEFIRSLDQNICPETFTNCWTLFLEEQAARSGKDSESYKQTELFGRLYILPYFGTAKVKDLTYRDYQQFINTAKPINKEVFAHKTLSKIRTCLKSFCRFCWINKYTEEIPGDLYVPKARPKYGKEILSPDDVVRLLQPSDYWYHSSLCFCLLTGMRPGEVFGLKKSDWQGSYVVIRRAVNYRNVVTVGKTKNAQRVVPLSGLARQFLEQTIRRNEEHHLFTDWIFCDINGGPGKQCSQRVQWNKIKKERNLPGSPYSFRHTFISLMKNDMPEQMLKMCVGHSFSMPTFEVYGHTVDGEVERAAKIINKVIQTDIKPKRNRKTSTPNN